MTALALIGTVLLSVYALALLALLAGIALRDAFTPGRHR